MFINKNSIIINGVNIGPYLVEAKFGFNKIWGEDSGRNLNGDMVATLIGIFPKIVLEFGPLTKEELEIITPILDSPRQTVVYYDPTKRANVTMTTYTGDYEISDDRVIKDGKKNKGFTCSFISTKKRS